MTRKNFDQIRLDSEQLRQNSFNHVVQSKTRLRSVKEITHCRYQWKSGSYNWTANVGILPRTGRFAFEQLLSKATGSR